jgi:hypothetical protein
MPTSTHPDNVPNLDAAPSLVRIVSPGTAPNLGTAGSGAVLPFARRHPERSRFSGVATDLPLNRRIASATLHNHRTFPNLDEISGRVAAPWQDGAAAPRKPSRKNVGFSP